MDGRTSTTQRVYRQRSSTGLAVVCAVTGILLLVSLVRNWADYPRPLFAAWILLGLAVAWSLFARPAVLLDVDGVTLRNVVRDVHIPWARITHVESRWNLKVFVGDRGFTAWAISTQPERPKRIPGGMFAMPTPGRLAGMAHADAKPSTADSQITAQSVTRLIRAAQQEYDEAVAQGQLLASPDAPVRITWVPLVLVVLLVPVVVVVALMFG